MLNKNVVNILGQVQKITNSVVLRYPVTIANAPAGDVLVSLNVKGLDSDEFEDIGIYNLGEFLDTFKLFDEREVEINDDIITVSHDNMSLQYISNNINLLQEFDKPVSIFEKTEEVPTVSEFVLEVDDIKKIKQASGIFKDLTEVALKSQDSDMNIYLSGSNKFNAKSNSFKLIKESNSNKEFEVRIPIDNFSKLPLSNYNVIVKYNQSRDAYRVLFYSTEIEDFKVLMAVKK